MQLPRLQLRLAPNTTIAYCDCDSLGKTKSGVSKHHPRPHMDHWSIRRLIMLRRPDKCAILQQLSQHTQYINDSLSKVQTMRP